MGRGGPGQIGGQAAGIIQGDAYQQQAVEVFGQDGAGMRGIAPEPLRVLAADGMQGQRSIAQHEQQEDRDAQVSRHAAGTAQAEAERQKQDTRQRQSALEEQLLPE